ncbi:hypothetical protein [Brevundimonas sp.]|uniref:hypothetical protein n=1 Tax=Brevundimonas sp. TaxID=1871086 RepID=UPI003D0F3161
MTTPSSASKSPRRPGDLILNRLLAGRTHPPDREALRERLQVHIRLMLRIAERLDEEERAAREIAEGALQ